MQPVGPVSPPERTIVTRTLTFVGIGLLSMCFAFLATSSWEEWAPLARVGFGAAMASLLVGGGMALGRLMKERWIGAGLIAGGYGLAYFFAFASHYITGMVLFEDAGPAWLLMLAVTVLCAAHGATNKVLRWFAAPFTLAMTGFTFVRAVSSQGSLEIAGLSVGYGPLVAVLTGIWCAVLCLRYRLEWRKLANATDQGDLKARELYYWGQELYYVLGAACAVAAPCLGLDSGYLPVCWAVESAALLAVSWRKEDPFKQVCALGLACASAAAMVVLAAKGTIAVAVVPPVVMILLGISLAYRYRSESLDQSFALSVHRFFIGAFAVSTPAVLMALCSSGPSLPYLALHTAVMVALVWALRDDVVWVISLIVSGWTVFRFGVAVFQADQMTWLALGLVVSVAYGASFLYRHILSGPKVIRERSWSQGYHIVRKDVPAVSGSLFVGKESLLFYEEDAIVAEWSYWIAGFVFLLTGALNLLSGANITIAWGIVAVAMSVLGVATGRFEHRLASFVAFALCFGKLLSVDLIYGDASRTMAFGGAGLCCLAGALIYALTDRKSKASQTPPVEPGNTAPPV